MNFARGAFVAFSVAAAFIGCSKELPREEFLKYYEEHCRVNISRSGENFSALALSKDYETAKWGAPLDSGFRVLLWAYPRTNVPIIDGAFFLEGSDTLYALANSKTPLFETGNTDSFFFAFARAPRGDMIFHMPDFGGKFGNLVFELKDCSRVRLKGNK